MKAGAIEIKESRQRNGKEEERLNTPPSNISANASVKAPVARARWLISVLEKCQIDPLCKEAERMDLGSPKKLEDTLPPWSI